MGSRCWLGCTVLGTQARGGDRCCGCINARCCRWLSVYVQVSEKVAALVAAGVMLGPLGLVAYRILLARQ